MSLPVASGVPQYAGTFIPQIWSSKLLTKFYASTVLSAISNTDYTGQISAQGDKVLIRTVPSLTIRDYTKGQTLQIERPESPNVELNIDKGKYFNFIVDDVDKVQSDLNLMDAWSNDASEQLKIVVDGDVLNTIPALISSANQGVTAGVKSGAYSLGATGASVALTKANILDYIIDMGTVLDEQNVPETGRWLVLPAWASNLLKKSDLKDASITGDSESVVRNGRLGMIDRFTLYNSNVLAGVTDGGNTCYNIMAGHKVGLTFAAQLTNMETLRAESTFGSLMRGLHVYGYQVVKPDTLPRLYARNG